MTKRSHLQLATTDDTNDTAEQPLWIQEAPRFIGGRASAWTNVKATESTPFAELEVELACGGEHETVDLFITVKDRTSEERCFGQHLENIPVDSLTMLVAMLIGVLEEARRSGALRTNYERRAKTLVDFYAAKRRASDQDPLTAAESEKLFKDLAEQPALLSG